MEVDNSLAYLESVLAHGPAGFAFLDRGLRYIHVNTRLAEINGLPVEAHLGRTVEEVLEAALWPSRRPLFEQALADKAVVEAELSERLEARDGARRRVSSSYYPVVSGGGSRGGRHCCPGFIRLGAGRRSAGTAGAGVPAALSRLSTADVGLRSGDAGFFSGQRLCGAGLWVFA
jgi:PAS domain S-box-containing protein